MVSSNLLLNEKIYQKNTNHMILTSVFLFLLKDVMLASARKSHFYPYAVVHSWLSIKRKIQQGR